MDKQASEEATRSNAILAANLKKQIIVKKELTMHDLNVTNNKNQRRITLSNQRRTRQSTNQKTNHVGRVFRGNSRREAYSKENSSIEYTQNSTTNCNGLLTEDWQRGQNVAAIKKHNAKNEQRREYPEWIIECEDQYKITKTVIS